MHPHRPTPPLAAVSPANGLDELALLTPGTARTPSPTRRRTFDYARRVLELLRDDPDLPDAVLGLRRAGGAELVVHGHRLDRALVGVTAPECSRAAALFGRSRDRRLGADHPLVVVADAEGVMAVVPHVPGPLEPEASPLTDALLRLLGRPTPRAPAAPAQLATTVWLHRCLGVALAHPAAWRLRWPELARLHPASASSSGARHQPNPGSRDLDHPAGRALVPGPVELGTVASDAWAGAGGWRRLAPLLDDAGIRDIAAHLDWFDEGSHHRAVTARLPEAADLAVDLACLCGRDTATAVATVLRHTARHDPRHDSRRGAVDPSPVANPESSDRRGATGDSRWHP